VKQVVLHQGPEDWGAEVWSQPFDPTKEMSKLKSWDQQLAEAKLEETEPLMARILAL
jgi:hypothetical protein